MKLLQRHCERENFIYQISHWSFNLELTEKRDLIGTRRHQSKFSYGLCQGLKDGDKKSRSEEREKSSIETSQIETERSEAR